MAFSTTTFQGRVRSQMSLPTRLFRLFEVRRQRIQLSELDHNLMKDLGISYEDRASELKRSFWDID